MINYKVININGKLYKIKRILPVKRIKMIDGWAEVLRTLYVADIIFKQKDQLYICENIDDIDYDPIP
tara:strand:+ start:147 stop:347 length:201 start_codon:yes stop_codon:yes gene_type:complete